MSKREKEKRLTWKSETIKKGLAPHQRLELEINDLITSFNKNNILIQDLADSSTIEVQAIRTEFNRLILEFDRKQRKSIELKLGAGAVTGACGKASEPLQQTIPVPGPFVKVVLYQFKPSVLLTEPTTDQDEPPSTEDCNCRPSQLRSVSHQILKRTCGLSVLLKSKQGDSK
jgi:hypothetical protein